MIKKNETASEALALSEFQSEMLVIKEPFLKRPFDFFLSLIGLIVSFPLWLVIATAIWLEDGRPIFYCQKRLGRFERAFLLFKFRSMVKDAEEKIGAMWATENDPRVTKVGRILRATAMDELPQLINILKGDISFVGPRAERPELVKRFKKEISGFVLRTMVRPGLTGVAQVYGRYDTAPRHKLRYDLLYIKNQSFLLDLRLILLSFWITFSGKWESREKKIYREKRTEMRAEKGARIKKKLIGQILLEARIITEEQLKEALKYQNLQGGKIGENLVRKRYISPEALSYFLNRQLAINGNQFQSS